jgi:hypothetical protein
MAIAEILLNSLGQVFGSDIILFIILVSGLLYMFWRFSLPLSFQYIIISLLVFLFGSYEINNTPLLPETFMILYTIVFGVVLGSMFYYFYVRNS